MPHLENVKQILSATLQLGERTSAMNPDTPLIGSIAELDSMAVVTVITALEDNYGFYVEDDEISAETFATLGSLAQFVSEKLA